MKTILTIYTCFFYSVSISAFAFQTGIVQEKSVCQSSLYAQKISFPVGGDFVVPDTVSENLFDELSSPPASEINVLSSPSGEEPRGVTFQMGAMRNGRLMYWTMH